jgi:hypothetical protein
MCVHLHIHAWAIVSNGYNRGESDGHLPVIVPWMTEPFFNSTVTVSLFSFMRNLEAVAGQTGHECLAHIQHRMRHEYGK